MSTDPCNTFYLDRRAFLKYTAAFATYTSGFTVLAWNETQVRNVVGDDLLPVQSFIYEEFKDDFAKARAAAENRVATAKAAQQSEDLADALLGLGVVQILQGQTAAASASFKQIEVLVPNDPARQLRAVSFAEMACYWQYNMFPNYSGGSVSDMESLQTQQFMKSLAEFEQRKKNLRAAVSDLVSLQESVFISDELNGIKSLQSALDSAATLPLTPQQRTQLSQQVFALLALSSDIQSTYPSAWQAFALRNRADLYRRSGDYSNANHLLSQAKQIYNAIGDKAGEAACWLLEGDAYAAPLSSPMVFNTAMNPPPNAGSSLSSLVMAKELDRSAIDTSKALAAYVKAEVLFAEAGNNPRAVAALGLRRAYLLVLNHDYQNALAAVNDAREQFRNTGDFIGYWTASAHVALLSVANGQLPEQSGIATGIGEWGKTGGSFSFALGLGFLHSRIAWHWLLRDADFERALACFRLAETLYIGLGSTPRRVQSIMDQGYLMRKLGERDMAQIHLQQAVELQLTEQTSGLPQDTNAPLRLLLSMHGLWQAYLDGMDADGMESVADMLQTQFDWIKAHPDLDNVAGSQLVMQLVQESIEYTQVTAPCYRALAARNDGDKLEAERYFALALAAADRIIGYSREFQLAIVHAHRKDYSAAAAAYKRYLPQQISISPLSQSIKALSAQIGADALLANEQQQWRNSQQQAATFFAGLKHIPTLRITFGNWKTNSARIGGKVKNILGKACKPMERLQRAWGNSGKPPSTIRRPLTPSSNPVSC